MKTLQIKLMRLRSGENDIPVPAYMSEGSAGMDIYAAIEDSVILAPMEVKLIPTGFSVEIPSGFEAQIRPRSGLAIKNSVGVLNSPGTLDSDYRGEIKVIIMNWGKSNFIINRKDRIAQMVIARIYRVDFNLVDKLDTTERGSGGFGHTGL